MIIQKSVLHILDFNSDMCIFSQRELDLSKTPIQTYLTKHLEKILSDHNQKAGSFRPNSVFLSGLQKYRQDELGFIEFANKVANNLHHQIARTDNLTSIDFLAVDFSEEDTPYFALLLLTNKEAYTHQVTSGEGGVCNEIIKHYAILPGTSQKIDSYAVINCNNYEIRFVDAKRKIEEKDVYVLQELLLECSSEIANKVAVKVVSKIATKVAEEYGANAAVAVSRAKSYLVENAEQASSFSPVALGREVFADSDIMRNEFERQIAEAELPSEVKMDKPAAIRAGKSHKIKTDTGVEITFPAEYFENHQFIEFVNNPDGTISIEIKNVGKIINR